MTQFWYDVWITSSPLRVGFPKLYDICEDRCISVAKCVGANWEIQFRMRLSLEAIKEWEEMQELLRGVVLSSKRDCVKWVLQKRSSQRAPCIN
jgi:hypothetical protein